MEMVGGGEKGHHLWADAGELRHCSMRPPTCPRGGGTPLPAAGRWGSKTRERGARRAKCRITCKSQVCNFPTCITTASKPQGA